jgi:hypothetical protein
LLPTQIWTGTYVGSLPWITLAVMQSFLFLPLTLPSLIHGLAFVFLTTERVNSLTFLLLLILESKNFE